MVFARAVLVMVLVGAGVSEGSAETNEAGAVAPLPASAATTAVPTLPPAPFDGSSPGAQLSLSTSTSTPPQHHSLLWLWGALGTLLIASIVVTAQQRTTPRPVYGSAGDRIFP